MHACQVEISLSDSRCRVCVQTKCVRVFLTACAGKEERKSSKVVRESSQPSPFTAPQEQ